MLEISIHALLAESDNRNRLLRFRFQISIHALLAESDQEFFAPVPSLENFYPRSPCGE